MYNSLLQRQIRKYLHGIDKIPEEYQPFFEALSASYDHFERDRKLMERSMDISSEEFLAINARLSHEAESQRLLLGKLRDSLAVLDLNDEGNEENIDEELLRVADLLQEQIEKRTIVEEQLQESEERFRLIAEHASDIIVRYNHRGVCQYISPSCLPQLGYHPEELIGKTPFELMYPRDIRRVLDSLEELLPQERRFVIDARVRRKDGVYRWFETSVHTVRDAKTGRLLEAHTIARDITDRKETEEELRTTSSRLAALVENLQGGVLVEDEHRTIAIVNQKFCDMFDVPVPTSALIGADCAQAAEDNKHVFADPEGYITGVNTILAEKRPVVGDELLLANGKVFERSYVPISVGKTYNGHLWHFIDITETKKAQDRIRRLNEELKQTNKLLKVERDREKENVKALQKLNSMKNEFISGVSHELRTPLASIIGFAQTLLLDPELPIETRTEFTQIIHDEGKRLSKLINDLLDIARIESGRVDIERRWTPLSPLLQRALQSITMQADMKSLALQTEFNNIDFNGWFDPDRLAQVVINLLGNAVKFTPEGGEIALRAEMDADEICISVADTGLGIPEEDLPHLFEKFYRVHRPGLDIRGTGLGLAIADQLVKLHKGTITVESQVGKGSIFTVRLPNKVESENERFEQEAYHQQIHSS